MSWLHMYSWCVLFCKCVSFAFSAVARVTWSTKDVCSVYEHAFYRVSDIFITYVLVCCCPISSLQQSSFSWRTVCRMGRKTTLTRR
ncbi:hypothetical protein M758_9G030600 [Ceratodon purpureus]|nr:hypothetical protein M758_9G030600 [Ceratodon purpureus]